MTELGTDDPAKIRAHGAIDLPTIQRYLNRWFTSSVDLFAGERSSNAAAYFGAGLKGRWKEEARFEDHVALEGVYALPSVEGERVTSEEVPLRNAMNEVLRDDYVDDCEFVVKRWNKVLEKAGRSERFYLPNRRFHRTVGAYASGTFDIEGNPLSPEGFEARKNEWLPSEADKTFVKSLMKPTLGVGQIAGWLAPPSKGINGNDFAWDYVRFDKSSAGVSLGAAPSLI